MFFDPLSSIHWSVLRKTTSEKLKWILAKEERTAYSRLPSSKLKWTYEMDKSSVDSRNPWYLHNVMHIYSKQDRWWMLGFMTCYHGHSLSKWRNFSMLFIQCAATGHNYTIPVWQIAVIAYSWDDAWFLCQFSRSVSTKKKKLFQQMCLVLLSAPTELSFVLEIRLNLIFIMPSMDSKHRALLSSLTSRDFVISFKGHNGYELF